MDKMLFSLPLGKRRTNYGTNKALLPWYNQNRKRHCHTRSIPSLRRKEDGTEGEEVE